jgi:murein L,D-transpeptidase YcbB/YkuD
MHANKQAQHDAEATANRHAEAIRKQNHLTQKANVRVNRTNAQAQARDFRDDRRDINQHNRNESASQRLAYRANRWDAKLDNKSRYKTYQHYRNNWSAQRNYLNSNLARFNQMAALNQQQQQLLDSQMQAAYLSYNHNNYNGAYNWSAYSNPQFLDYLQNNKPSLLQQILGALGLGGNDCYLYSSDWNDERSQLSQNLGNIHQLAVEGRITSQQEQTLVGELRPEYMSYKNNSYNGNPSWSQYSDPGFVDYLNTRKPTILATIRDYLVR